MADKLDVQFNKYRDASVASSFSRDEGLLVIPVMGPAGTAPAVVRTHAPYGTRNTEFTFDKQSTPPLFPAIADTVSGDVMLGAVLVTPAPITDQQNNLVYRVRGSYHYVQPLGGRGQGDNFPIDAYPFPTRIDTLGELKPDITNPDVMTALGQWYGQHIDTTLFTGDRIIG